MPLTHATPLSAKYIEGLENRLGRMEHLLRLSGLLGEDEEGAETDLGTLEQRLAQARGERGENGSPSLRLSGSIPPPAAAKSATPQEASRQDTPVKQSQAPSPSSAAASPVTSQDGKKERRRSSEVEALQEMMDSLVTNSHGETRFIGSRHL